MRPDEINKIVEYIKEQTDHKGDIFININKNAIPIEWIKNWFNPKYANTVYYSLLRDMIKDWEKENDNN